ncbi:MAG: hypothetical protein BGN97_17205 [Microbacterium sp. 69-10]|uniref:hypothetical protein n=1 Tax=Microbacterium sp. 69-10 TaxID=1895783 RepID=UPI00095E7C83|nr:hypothetical protein [Microbacterium sp. 69-10]OJU41095.1 MAG: hypothetical protein BGN97_17205 [Microbacterium sp. 69-10]
MSASDEAIQPVAGTFPEKLAHVLNVIKEQSAALEVDRAANAAVFAASERKRAEAARSGELGPEWRIIQRRIDAEETTFGDVFSGADTSREAEALRSTARRNLAQLRASWEDPGEENDDTGRPEQLAPHLQAQGMAREAREQYDQLAAQIAQALRDAQRGGQR